MVEPRFSHIDTWHRLDLQSTKPSSKRRSISKRSWASIQFWKNADFLASFFLAVFFGCWFFWKIAGEIGETWALYEKGSVYILHLYVNSQYCSCFWHFVPSFWGSEMVFSGWKLFWLRAPLLVLKHRCEKHQNKRWVQVIVHDITITSILSQNLQVAQLINGSPTKVKAKCKCGFFTSQGTYHLVCSLFPPPGFFPSNLQQDPLNGPQNLSI